MLNQSGIDKLTLSELSQAIALGELNMRNIKPELQQDLAERLQYMYQRCLVLREKE